MNWILTIISIAVFIMAMVVLFHYLYEFGRKCKDAGAEYEKKYLRIEKIIDTYEVCDQNYDWICSLFENLSSLKYKNDEMTKVLNDRFKIKYQAIIENRRKEIN